MMEWLIAISSTVEKETEEKLTILKACPYLLVKGWSGTNSADRRNLPQHQPQSQPYVVFRHLGCRAE